MITEHYVLNQNIMIKQYSHSLRKQSLSIHMFKQLLIGILLIASALAEDGDNTDSDADLSVGERWGFGLLAGIILSAFGFIAAFVLVCVGKRIDTEKFKNFVRVLFALACGTLIGDAVIHILAEAYQLPQAKEFFVSLIFIASLLGFMLLEKVMEKMGISHNHWVDEHPHQHEGHGGPYKEIEGELNPEKFNESQADPSAVNTNAVNKKPKTCLQKWSGKGSAGYLNLLGSFIHNFVDGLSIGLVFATGQKHVITPMIIAIFTHEIPRELGDVAILLQNRFTGCQAILSNGIINFMSLIGVIVGLSTVGVSQEAQCYIMVFVAGNFMYIAADIWRNLFQQKFVMNVLQVLAFAGGVACMFGIKELEDSGE